jgi:hypothetical protein
MAKIALVARLDQAKTKKLHHRIITSVALPSLFSLAFNGFFKVVLSTSVSRRVRLCYSVIQSCIGALHDDKSPGKSQLCDAGC